MMTELEPKLMKSHSPEPPLVFALFWPGSMRKKLLAAAVCTVFPDALLPVAYLCTGERRGEMCAIQLKDIDFEKNTIRIYKTVTHKGNEPEIHDYTKTPAGVREVPLLSMLRDAFGADGSVRDACERHGIGSGQIYTWRRQAMSGELTGLKIAALPAFAEVRVADVAAPAPQPATSTSGLICIEFPGGVRVSVDGSVDAGALARVLSVLR